MKIYISYFAQIRNFPPNMIGFSTAKFEPKWLQKGQSQNGIYWMGIPPLKPGKECDGLCNGKCIDRHPESCAFLKTYRAQLDRLNFNEIIEKMKTIALKIQKSEGFQNVGLALLVYETPQNKCSERIVLQQWFKDNGMELEEWKKTK